MKTQVAIAKCADYDPARVQEAVKRAVDSLGGISAFIKPGSKVLVKPNLLMAALPEKAIDTHPEVLRAVIRLLKGIDCRITVGDGPSVWGNQIENVEEVYARSGTKKVCDEEGVLLVKFEKRRMREKFPLTTYLDECEYLVNIPKFKTHEFTLLTGAIKNLFGLVSGTFKTELHKNYFRNEDFSAMLVQVLEESRPALTVIDGITAMEGDGPASGGSPRHCGLILAGKDCVALDSVLAKIMGINPLGVVTTQVAASRNLGVADLKQIDFPLENPDTVAGRPFILPSSSLVRKIPGPVECLVKRFIKYLPFCDHAKCVKCCACIDACPKKVISMENKMITFDYRGCIFCFCCEEACPASAIKVKKSLLAKLMGL